MLTCHDVAMFFLIQVDEEDESADSISNLKLQKLVYYAQGVFLGLRGTPLFDDEIEAWQHGPVVPALYHEYKQYGSRAIPRPMGFDPSIIDASTRAHLERVYCHYAQFSAWKLREMTHLEAPWVDAYQRCQGSTIGKEAMMSYFMVHAPVVISAQSASELEKAVAVASMRSEQEQVLIAAKLNRIIEEIDDETEDEHLWQEQFAGSHDVLESLFDEAMEEYRAGRTKSLA